MPTWQKLREQMVSRQLRRRGIRDERVLVAMAQVRRHEFIPSIAPHAGYGDEARPIGAEQTISQPYMVAAMAAACALQPTDKVLEVGAGSGYAAAVMAMLAGHVYTIERIPALALQCHHSLCKAGLGERVTLIQGDGAFGYPEQAPFQAISVAAGAREIPPALLEQMDPHGGRLVIPVGPADHQDLLLVKRFGERTETRTLVPCRFVPLKSEGLP